MVVTQGVFEQDGGCAPLDEIARICEEQEALLVIDDCLGVGVMGDAGQGTAKHFGIEKQVVLINGSFGKGKRENNRSSRRRLWRVFYREQISN